MKVRHCPLCHGRGERLEQVIQSVARALATSAVRVVDTYWEKCQDCGGTGRIKASGKPDKANKPK
jgi:DnaJ-class molecular chaperone